MENFRLPCETQYDNNLSQYRAIQRYVCYQIRNMVNSDLQLGRILTVNNQGILGVKRSTRLLTEEQKREAQRLINNYRDGIYLLHQFKDLNEKIESKDEYSKWLDEAVTNTFMHTIPTREVFFNDPDDAFFNLREKHSWDEINRGRESFGGYSIYQILYALKSIHPAIVGMLLSGDVDILREGYKDYVSFEYDNKVLYCRTDSLDLFEKDANGEFMKLSDTIHTLLFKKYQQPLNIVLNSIMFQIGGIHVLPGEGLHDSMDSEIEKEAYDVITSEKCKVLTENYNLGLTRRFY